MENYVEKNLSPKRRSAGIIGTAAESSAYQSKGIAALYYYYCYELHIIVRFPASVKKVSAAVREDLRKLERLDEQTRFLAANGIENHEDLDRYRSNATDELTALTSERDALRNKLKRVIRTGDEAAILEVKKQIAAVSDRMKKLKTTFKICDSVEEERSVSRSNWKRCTTNSLRKENSDELFGTRRNKSWGCPNGVEVAAKSAVSS